MAKQRSRKNKDAAKSKRKSRSMAAKAHTAAVLRQRPSTLFPTAEVWLGLMAKNAAAFADLQMHLVCCRSLMDLWTEQVKYINGRIDDAYAVLKGFKR
jgi:hypothetical protein